jgi:hypothetical protein
MYQRHHQIKDTSCEMQDDLAGKMELPPSPEECVSIDKEEQTVEIVDDSATVESVTLPPEDKDDENLNHNMSP